MADNFMKKSGFLDRTFTSLQRKAVVNILRTWEDITGTARALTGAIDPDLPKQDAERLMKHMKECLNHKGGEVSARRNTIGLGHIYLNLSDKGKEKFFKMLAKEFDVSHEKIKEKMQHYLDNAEITSRTKSFLALQDMMEPPRVKILRQFNGLPEGMKFLVDMRADLLQYKRTDPDLNALEADFRKLLASWFDVGLLDMQQITWQSPASLLEKLIAYEAVHAISSWADLKNRLDSDRRCFAFFHHKMPDEPLIFVEVALVTGMADNIQVLLDETQPSQDPQEADTAIFYSISNAQAGLTGISFGNFLIKRVVDKLSAELKGLKHFVTLSPIPGFRAWLDPQLKSGDESLLTTLEMKAIRGLKPKERNAALILLDVLESDWYAQTAKAETLKKPLMRLCAHYLLEMKKNGKAMDPVANFHLSNGAQMERLNWLADTSKKGMKQSAGIMVNYSYHLTKIEDYHEAYSSGKALPAANQVKALVKK